MKYVQIWLGVAKWQKKTPVSATLNVENLAIFNNVMYHQITNIIRGNAWSNIDDAKYDGDFYVECHNQPAKHLSEFFNTPCTMIRQTHHRQFISSNYRYKLFNDAVTE